MVIYEYEMIHRPLLAALALAVLPVLASAQVNPRNLDNLSDDFGVYVGAYMPMYKGHEADVVYALSLSLTVLLPGTLTGG